MLLSPLLIVLCRIYDYPDDITDTLILDEPESSERPPMSAEGNLVRQMVSSSSSDNSTASSSSSNPTQRQLQPTNEELMATCRTFLDRLQRGAAPWVVQRLSSQYGQMPTDPALFAYWVALVLPIEEHEKAKLLPIRSKRLRLMLVVHWIEQLNNNWYAWLCCFVLAPLEGWLFMGPGQLFFVLLLAIGWAIHYYWS